MNYRSTTAALATLALLLLAGTAQAAEGDHWNGYAQGATDPAAKSAQPSKRKPPAKVKLVDINGAKAAQLKKLPGIGDAEAAKIIASRPYGSKSWLVGDKILSEEQYEAIKNLIEAKQPYTDGAKNAALYKNRH